MQLRVQSELIKGGSMVELQGCQQGLSVGDRPTQVVCISTDFAFLCHARYVGNNFGASQILKGLNGEITMNSARLLSLVESHFLGLRIFVGQASAAVDDAGSSTCFACTRASCIDYFFQIYCFVMGLRVYD